MLQLGNIRFVPSIHQRMAFADEVRRAASEHNPDCIAVELPPGLADWIMRGVMRLPAISAVCHPSPRSEGEMVYLPIDPCDSMIEAVRIGVEHEIAVEFIDGAPAGGEAASLASMMAADLPDDWMIERTGLEAYVAAVTPFLSGGKSAEDAARERFMAERLARLSRKHERVLCVLGIAHFVPVRRGVEWIKAEHEQEQREGTENAARSARIIKGSFLSNVAAKSISETLREIPWLAWQREERREEQDAHGESRFDKLGALAGAIKEAGEKYRETYKSEVTLTRLKALVQFTRNLALVYGRLQPSTVDMAIGAKSVVDGDYGYELYRLLRSYPPQEEETDLPNFTLHKDRGTFSDRPAKYSMKCAFEQPETEWVNLRFRRRPPESLKRRWKEEWDSQNIRGICSWPPEDELQEKFMMHVRKRALEVLGADKRQVLEFTTSILDGLDIRETMRNWHTGKLYVQQTPQPQGDVGAVVLIFDEPANDDAYPWRLTLYAENQNESDISFYATPLGAEVVGPRITKTQFGGILSIFPARGIPDIFSFPGVEQLSSCAEALMAGAALFAERKFIAYVAAKPPTSVMRELASRNGKYIVHLPLRNFSRDQLKKVRKFHILNGRDVRGYAADYIFD